MSSTISSMTSHSDGGSESDSEHSHCSQHSRAVPPPPPPPHLELLKLTAPLTRLVRTKRTRTKKHHKKRSSSSSSIVSAASYKGEGHCITHVISYLPLRDRRSASCSCTYLRDAVIEYVTSKRDRDTLASFEVERERQEMEAERLLVLLGRLGMGTIGMGMGRNMSMGRTETDSPTPTMTRSMIDPEGEEEVLPSDQVESPPRLERVLILPEPTMTIAAGREEEELPEDEANVLSLSESSLSESYSMTKTESPTRVMEFPTEEHDEDYHHEDEDELPEDEAEAFMKKDMSLFAKAASITRGIKKGVAKIEKSEAELQLEKSRHAAAQAKSRRLELEHRFRAERASRENALAEKKRKEREARRALAAEVERRRVELEREEDEQRILILEAQEERRAQEEEASTRRLLVEECERVERLKLLEEKTRLEAEARAEAVLESNNKKSKDINMRMRTRRTILDEMDDLEHDVLERSPPRLLSNKAQRGDDDAMSASQSSNDFDEWEEEDDQETIHTATSSMPPAPPRYQQQQQLQEEDKEGNDEIDEMESISTVEMKARTDTFLQRVSQHGIETPNTFQEAPSYCSESTFNYEQSILEENLLRARGNEDKGLQGRSGGLNTMPSRCGLDDELSVVRTASSIMEDLNTPVTPLNPPVLFTPSPASYSGATRLELDSTDHLGDGSQHNIFGRMQEQAHQVEDDARNAKAGNNSSCVPAMPMDVSKMGNRGKSTRDMQQQDTPKDESNLKNEEPLLSSESKSVPTMPQPRFTNLRKVSAPAPKEETPFDEEEIPMVTKSAKSVSFSFTCKDSSPKVNPMEREESEDDSSMDSSYCREDSSMDSSCREESPTLTDSDSALAQVSDADLFGAPRIVTDFIEDLVDSAKQAVSHLALQGGVRRNNIDDNGPIKIGEKYYSHNEALRLWRKSKVKCREDQFYHIDEDGDVKMEGAAFSEKNSRLQWKDQQQQHNTLNAKNNLEEDYELKSNSPPRSAPSNDSNNKTVRKSSKPEETKVSINDFFSRYNTVQPSKSIDSTTVQAGNVGNNGNSEDEHVEEPKDKKLLSFLDSVNESEAESKITADDSGTSSQTGTSISCTTHTEETSVLEEAGNCKTADTESKAKSTAGMGSSSADVGMGTNAALSEATRATSSETTSHLESTNNHSREKNSQVDSGITKDDKAVKKKVANLKKSIQLKRTREIDAQATTEPQQQNGSDRKNQRNETESVAGFESIAGKDSLPSHMGSMYGVEVTSLRGMNCNFIQGKKSEKVKIGGGKSIKSIRGKDCEQSLLGSQYGTEVLFTPAKKVSKARKPRTLGSHNMGVKSAKQGNGGAAASIKHNTSSKQHVSSNAKGPVARQNACSGNNRGSLTSLRQQSSSTTPSSKTVPQDATKVQKKKPKRLPLKKLKLGMRKSVSRR